MPPSSNYAPQSKLASLISAQTTTVNFNLIQSDTMPPVRSKGSPTGILTANTSQATISLDTNETAVCKYSASANISYSLMPDTFSFTNSVSHSQAITGLINGQSYTYYV